MYDDANSQVDMLTTPLGPAVARLQMSGGVARVCVGPDFVPTPDRLMRLTAFRRHADCFFGLAGEVDLSLEANAPPDGPSLCVAAAHPGQIPIPDWRHLLDSAPAVETPPWRSLAPQAFWRGSVSACPADIRAAMAAPAVQLCLAGRHQLGLDARLSPDLSDAAAGDPFLQSLHGLGLTIAQETDALVPSRYLIDLEGDDAPRTGLADKLLRACVIRVGRPSRVWYDAGLAAAGGVVCVEDPRKVADTVARLEASGDGERVWRIGRAHIQGLTIDVARAAFRQSVVSVLTT